MKMSETKKLEELLQSMNDRLSNIEKTQKEQSKSTEQHTSSKPHTHSGNVEFDCPDCQKVYDANVKSQALKEFKEKIKSKDLVICDGCGDIVEKEAEECPSCHGKNGH